MKIGINGASGIIGRLVTRIADERGLDIGVLNDVVSPKQLEKLIRFNSDHGEYPIELINYSLITPNQSIPVISQSNIKDINWSDYNVNTVIDCTGLFDTYENLQKFTDNGVKNVIISKPKKSRIVFEENCLVDTVLGADNIQTIVIGVNEDLITPNQHYYSMGSCTTNSISPLLKHINRKYGIVTALFNTVHSPTAKQNVKDGYHSSEEFMFSTIDSMIVSSSGADKVISEIMPDLFGKIRGSAVRIPTTNVSFSYVVCTTKVPVKNEAEFNQFVKDLSENELKGVLGYDEYNLSSRFFNSRPETGIYSPSALKVVGSAISFGNWYDNEFGFASKLVDVARRVSGSKISLRNYLKR